MGDRISVGFVSGGERSVVLFHHWGGEVIPEAVDRYVKTYRALIAKAEAANAEIEKHPYNPVDNSDRVAAVKKWGEESFVLSGPLGRAEPNTVMVDFLKFFFDNYRKRGQRIESSLYFGATPDDGDNSDNGHLWVDVTTGTVVKSERCAACDAWTPEGLLSGRDINAGRIPWPRARVCVKCAGLSEGALNATFLRTHPWMAEQATPQTPAS